VKRALTSADHIERNDYMGILAQDGWETLEATVRTNHAKKFADNILAAIRERAPKAAAKPAAKVAPKPAAKAAAVAVVATPAAKSGLPADLEGLFIEFRQAKGKGTARGVVLCQNGKLGFRILNVLTLERDVPTVKECDVVKAGKNFAEFAASALK
jgi:hypothetical protein